MPPNTMERPPLEGILKAWGWKSGAFKGESPEAKLAVRTLAKYALQLEARLRGDR